MVDAVTIRNFRSFNEAKLTDCRRINILVGENGSGKTALLEAIFLAAGVSPELAIRTRSWRGFESDRMSGLHEDLHQALWADLFHKFRNNRTAVISLHGRGDERRSVEIQLHKQDQKKIIPARTGKPSLRPQSAPFQFRYKVGDARPFDIEPYFENDRLIYPSAPISAIKATFFAANRTPPSGEMTNRFSLLSRIYQTDRFLRVFKNLYPQVKNISIEVTAAAPMLFVELEHLPEKLPISLVSGGMNKLAALLLAIANQADGLVIVDEIENGFFHRRLPEIWTALHEFAREYNCQLFVSTHSAECLDAAAQLAHNAPGDFSVIRTVMEEGETKLRHLEGKDFVEALEERIDVR